MKTDIKKHENGGAKSWIKAHLSDIIPVLGLISLSKHRIAQVFWCVP